MGLGGGGGDGGVTPVLGEAGSGPLHQRGAAAPGADRQAGDNNQ